MGQNKIAKSFSRLLQAFKYIVFKVTSIYLYAFTLTTKAEEAAG